MSHADTVHSSTHLTLYNTASRELEVFVPNNPAEVTVYTCGPTVYDYTTIGNLRSYVFADILRRILAWNGYRVRSTMNFTDFGHLSDDADAGEDKILRALQKQNLPLTLESMRSFTSKYIDLYKQDASRMNITPPTQYVRASDFVAEQIKLIRQLEEKGYTYTTSDGVYFSIESFPSYGTLGNIDLSKLKSGARIAVNPEKQHPADFALWKRGDLGWESPWGHGFPGWHIECSTMAMETLGPSIDIHTGGIDLQCTHHNAEIAQSEAATGKTFVKYWLHNAFITIDGQRVGKSIGNAITIPELEAQGYDPVAYRYWLLTSHYRSTVNFTYEALDQSQHALKRLQRHFYEEYKAAEGVPDDAVLDHFTIVLNNDLDTPRALAVMWDLVRNGTQTPQIKAATLRKMDEVLGIGLHYEYERGLEYLGIADIASVDLVVEELVSKREAARAARDWGEADRLRDEIKASGYEVVDTSEGPRLQKL